MIVQANGTFGRAADMERTTSKRKPTEAKPSPKPSPAFSLH